MRWRGREQSTNVEDRRGMKPAMAIGGGGGFVAIIVMLILKFSGASPEMQNMAKVGLDKVGQMQMKTAGGGGASGGSGAGIDDDVKEFISVVLRDTETVWAKIFDTTPGLERIDYQAPKLVLFEGSTNTKCGMGQSAMGPFYCPADQCVYIDPSFFNDLATRHNAPGDFAQAYVIAHEVAHHVQNLLGDSQRLHKIRAGGRKDETNRGSVRLELQADYLAGVWAHHAQMSMQILEDGDLEEALNAASQIGDDTLQKMSTGHVDVSKFTHGSSNQRIKWFREGLKRGQLADKELLWELGYDDL